MSQKRHRTYFLLASIIVTFSAGRRAGLTEDLHLWTRPDRGSREGYWPGKLSKNLFFLLSLKRRDCGTFFWASWFYSTVGPVFSPLITTFS